MLRPRPCLLRTVFLLSWLFRFTSHAGEPADETPLPAAMPPVPPQKWIVGLADEPPFNIHNADGSWTGICVELWEEIAKELNLNYELRETNLAGRFDGLRQGWLDVSIGPLTITAEREQSCDFTHAYFVSGLGVALPVSKGKGSNWFGAGLLSWNLWRSIGKLVFGLLAALGLAACLMWLCERRLNAPYFGHGNPVRGLGSAFWWAAVTMTTVGYGDVSPRTLKGRAVAVVWMFVSLVLVSAFTATMASILTAERLASAVVIRQVEDLRRLRVGTAVSAEKYLQAHRVPFQTFPADQLLEALRRGKVQAVVYDQPLLRYQIATEYPGQFRVLPQLLNTELYGFALREGSSLREPINRLLLRKVHEPAWHDLLFRYLGSATE